MSSMFTKARKEQLKAMVAVCGPSGAGKTWTALQWGGVLGKRIAVIDTENRSASFYADHFDFDVLDWAPPYDAAKLTNTIREVARTGDYDVLIIDSLSHFWEGEGGVIDAADAAGKRKGGNSWAGWSEATPMLRHLIDMIRSCGLHVIVCMRSEMETVQETDERTGKKVVKRLGMSPRMRKGVEYEFTVVVDMDIEHTLTVGKTRCDLIDRAVARAGRAVEVAETFRDWLAEGVEPTERVTEPPPAATPAVETMRDRMPPTGGKVSAKWAKVVQSKLADEQVNEPPDVAAFIRFALDDEAAPLHLIDVEQRHADQVVDAVKALTEKRVDVALQLDGTAVFTWKPTEDAPNGEQG